MPNTSKIIGEKHELALQLAQQNTPIAQAGKILGVARDTYKAWLLKNGISLPTRTYRNQQARDQFLQICERVLERGTTIKLNATLQKIKLHPDEAQRLLRAHPHLKVVIRSKPDATREDHILTLPEVQARLPDQSHKVLERVKNKYKIQAPDGFIYYKPLGKIHQGDPRGKCGTRLSKAQVAAKLKDHGYTLVEESYTIKRKSLKAIHDVCGVVRENRLVNFFTQDCPRCTNTGVSKAETTLAQWVESLGFTTEKYRFKGKTKGKEIDIFIPSVSVGIEYCGLYWHSEPRSRSKTIHYDKFLLARDHNIRLLTVFEDEWLSRTEAVKGFIRSVLNSYDLKIGARKCAVRQIPSSVGAKFCDQHHIQGAAQRSIIYLGLFYSEDLIGVMSAGHHHRQSNGTILVLNRLCFAAGIQVVGGASKLFKTLVAWARDNNYNQIISWSDNRWSWGLVYRKLGFQLETLLPPDYSYTRDFDRFSKQSLKKTPQERLSQKTEWQLRRRQGFGRIWDCGKIRWTFNLAML